MSLEKEIVELLKGLGAVSVGFANLETLAGSPPSADLKYLLPEARSAVSFALPLNRELLRGFLAKKDQLAHEADFVTTTHRSGEISAKVKSFLETKGYQSASTERSGVYGRELPNWQKDVHPDISHRYIAVRSGVGSFGWSGNVESRGSGPRYSSARW